MDPRSWRPSILGIQFATLDRSEAANLEGIFTEEEVLEALMDMNGDKALGPNGFTVAFWQSSRDVVRGEVIGMFRDLFAIGKVVRNLNSTFLVLIPKKGGAKDLIDFRPISLVGSLYKLLSKVLANRLKKVISKVVSPTHNAFVEGRQILDASLIANEVIDSTLKNKDKGILCKLDIEKAYDHLNWDFLFSVMNGMSFGMKWIDWIKWCITSASFSVLVNGSLARFFQRSRRLRQGNPLSPYLFVLGMETLSRLTARAVEGGFLFGYKV